MPLAPFTKMKGQILAHIPQMLHSVYIYLYFEIIFYGKEINNFLVRESENSRLLPSTHTLLLPLPNGQKIKKKLLKGVEFQSALSTYIKTLM
jgi:hypothetical protein